jgi:hypothetical protein
MGLFPSIYGINDKKTSKERHETIENAQKRSETVMKWPGTVRNGERSGTVNGLKPSYCTRSRSETFTKSRSSKTKELL